MLEDVLTRLHALLFLVIIQQLCYLQQIFHMPKSLVIIFQMLSWFMPSSLVISQIVSCRLLCTTFVPHSMLALVLLIEGVSLLRLSSSLNLICHLKNSRLWHCLLFVHFSTVVSAADSFLPTGPEISVWFVALCLSVGGLKLSSCQ